MPQIRYDLYTRAFAMMLKVERKRRLWSLQDMAKRTNLTRSAVSAYERGQCAPTFGNIVKIAETFNVPLSDMMRAVENVARVLERNHDAAIGPTPAGKDTER